MIKASSLHGFGAFSRVELPSNTCIGEYIGVNIVDDEANPQSDYRFSVMNGFNVLYTIDAQDPQSSSWVRYINTSMTPKGANVRFYQHSKRIFVKTLRRIPVGTELLAYYGKEEVEFIRSRL